MTLSCKVSKQRTDVTPILAGNLFHEIAINKQIPDSRYIQVLYTFLKKADYSNSIL